MLIIRAPIQKRPSKSLKNTIVASTNGNITTAALVDGKPLTVGLNAYISAR